MRRVLGLLALVVLTAGACGPERDVAVGIKEGATDIVYGGTTTTEPPPPPPLPLAAVEPGFPTLFAPPPPPLAPAPVVEPEIIPDPCPPTPSDVAAIPAPAKLDGVPEKGGYVYEQNGKYLVGAAATSVNQERGRLEPLGRRIVSEADPEEGTFAVASSAFGTTRTNSYRVRRDAGSSVLDGLYLTRIVNQSASGVEEFTPASPGLLVFPEPAQVGATWRSAAVDPIRATSMTLEGRIAERQNIDVCGPRVEAWVAEVTITVRKAGAPDSSKDFVETLRYAVAPQYGGLILADTVSVTGSDRGVFFKIESYGTLKNLLPQQ